MKIEAGKSYVMKNIVSTHSIYLTDNQQQKYITTAINKDKFRRILVFFAPSLCISLPVVRHCSSLTILGSRAEVWDGER